MVWGFSNAYNKSVAGIYNITVTAFFSNADVQGCEATSSIIGVANLGYDPCYDVNIT
jgi:hypothetical protein